MFAFMENALARRSANRVCGTLQHRVARMIADGENPMLGYDGISIAVGVDQIDGTVWGLRPNDAVDIRQGRVVRREWRNNPQVAALIIHETSGR